jgi:glycerol-3-phosphate acyltransferase PlsY
MKKQVRCYTCLLSELAHGFSVLVHFQGGGWGPATAGGEVQALKKKL